MGPTQNQDMNKIQPKRQASNFPSYVIPAELQEFGIREGVDMCRKLLEGGAPGLHFYTLNLEKVVVGILKGLGKINDSQAAAFQAVEADAKFMVSAQGITTGTKGNRPALPGNRPLSEADPLMHQLVQQEKARQTRWGNWSSWANHYWSL